MKYSLVASLAAQGTLALASLVPVHFRAPSPAHFLDIVGNDTYDFGCRPAVRPTDDGRAFQLHALLSEDQIAHLDRELAGHPDLSLQRELGKRQNGGDSAPIGTGDRFRAGAVAPSGLGTKPAGSTIASLMNVREIGSAVQGLVQAYGASTLALPYKTFEGASQSVAYVGAGADRSKYHLYLSAGVHARERGGPDQLIYWVADLLAASRSGAGLAYGAKAYTNAQVKAVLAAGIVFFPLVNPDGVAYDQATGSLWRKNRNTRSGSSGAAVGVDINRNFDFLWNFRKHFDPRASPASNSPSSQVYCGTAPASEPETKNHVAVYSSFPKIRWFMDVHSAAGDLLYSWGDDDNQAGDAAQNFRNAAYDGRRGVVGDGAYREYMPQADAQASQAVAQRTVAAMRAVAGRDYAAIQAVGLYATSGASDDYAFSRHLADPAANKVYSYTLEFGYSTNFYPTLDEFNQNILDTNAGFMDWALGAIAAGLE